MDELAKGLYIVPAGHPQASPTVARMWHDCEEMGSRRDKRKSEGKWRAELNHMGGGKYQCPFCDFRYPAA